MSRLSERIENFFKAYTIYEMAVIRYKQDETDILNHMSLIQAFELAYELAWKVLKDYMYELGVRTSYPKEVIKEAFAHDTISNGELWIEMLETRNATSHEYKMEKVNLMLEKISTIYFQEMQSFSHFAGAIDGK